MLKEWMELGVPFPFPLLSQPQKPDTATKFSAKEILGYLDSITDPEQAADLISCAVLKGAVERQAILEAVDVETRLRRLTKFLLVEVRRKREEGRE